MTPQISIAILGAGVFTKIDPWNRTNLRQSTHPSPSTRSGTEEPRSLGLDPGCLLQSEKSAKDLADQIKTDLGADVKVYHDADPHNSLDNLFASDIDAVIVVLLITIQPKIILKALAAGKHVLSEKPVAADVKSGLELIQEYNTVYKPKGLIWRVGENFEADTGIQAIGKAIRDGKIGKVTNFSVSIENFITQGNQVPNLILTYSS
jgi:predicted dehydrogenase